MNQPANTLDPLHLAWLRESAISPEVAAAAGLESIHDAKAAAKLFGRAPQHWVGHLPVLCFPYRQPGQRDPVLFRGRPAKPFERRKADGSTQLAKYVQASGTGTHLYFPPRLLRDDARRDASVDLLITEGERKGLAADSAGFACLALPGVSQWNTKGEKTLHPEFASITLRGRRVYLCFDADSLSNAQVRKQELACGRALEAEGATVYIVRFPSSAGKLDDFLATREPVEFAALLDDARKNGALPADVSGASASSDWATLWPSLRIDPDNDRPVRDIDNLVEIFANHPAWKGCVAYDARFERVTLTREPPCGGPKKASYPRAIVDADETAARLWLVRERALGWKKAPSLSDVSEAITAAAQLHRFDAVQEYLRGLEWDGVERLRRVATDYLGAEDTLYHREVVARWLMSAVARARTPGAKADHVLILEGDQGIGKSSAFEALAGGEPYYSGSLPPIGTKDAHEHCVGPWLVELQELAATTKSDVEHVKAFVSDRAPRFRHSYGRRSTEHPRRCVFGASTNDAGYLRDSTGNRRFWPVKCGAIDVSALRRDRDQIWAEALVRVRAGDPWHLDTSELQDVAKGEQEARESDRDPWIDAAERLLLLRAHITPSELLDELGIEQRSQDQRYLNRAARALRGAGLVRCQIRLGFDKRSWVYMRPVRGTVTGDGGDTGDGPSPRNHSEVTTVTTVTSLNSKRSVDPTIGTRGAPVGAPRPITSTPSTRLSGESGGDTGDRRQAAVIAGDLKTHTGDRTGDGPLWTGDTDEEHTFTLDDLDGGDGGLS